MVILHPQRSVGDFRHAFCIFAIAILYTLGTSSVILWFWRGLYAPIEAVFVHASTLFSSPLLLFVTHFLTLQAIALQADRFTWRTWFVMVCLRDPRKHAERGEKQKNATSQEFSLHDVSPYERRDIAP
jgi:hypothetical protein